MAGTTNFGPVTVNPGTRTFGPATLSGTDTTVNLIVDRTITGGFNATPAATAKISFEQSNDGGATWQELVSGNIAGGILTGHGGQTITVSSVGTNLWPGTSRQGRAVVTIAGAAVAVQGSLVIS